MTFQVRGWPRLRDQVETGFEERPPSDVDLNVIHFCEERSPSDEIRSHGTRYSPRARSRPSDEDPPVQIDPRASPFCEQSQPFWEVLELPRGSAETALHLMHAVSCI